MRYRVHAEGWPVPTEVEAVTLWDALYEAGRFSARLSAETARVARVEVYTLASDGRGGVTAKWLECRP